MYPNVIFSITKYFLNEAELHGYSKYLAVGPRLMRRWKQLLVLMELFVCIRLAKGEKIQLFIYKHIVNPKASWWTWTLKNHNWDRIHFFASDDAAAQNLAVWHRESKASVPDPGPACRDIDTRRLTPREEKLVRMVPSTLRGMFSSVCRKEGMKNSKLGVDGRNETVKTLQT